ncbi:hypothetical protein CBL_08294 [Carabus blaptoides fortunei]
MFNKHMLVVCTLCLVLVLMLDGVRSHPVQPKRPQKFENEEQLRQYIREVKQYIDETVRTGRYGKRNNLAPSMVFKSYPKQDEPEVNNDYDYYAQFNI